MLKYRFAKKRKRSAFLPFLPIATPLSLGLTVMTAIFLPSVRSVTRISRTAAGFSAFFMNVAGSSLYSMISCFLPVIMTGKKHEIIEYSEDPATFMKNALKPAAVREIRVTERTDGKKMAVITVNPKDKGVAIGKNGKNAERLRFLAKRYFNIQNVSIT